MKKQSSSNVVVELNSVKESDIKRGYIYWSIIPFTEERPLGIFKHLKGNKGKRIKEETETFKARFNEKKGKSESKIVDVIIRHKRRMVVVIQSDEVNHRFVYVLPITTFNGENEKLDKIKKNPNLPQYQYIGNYTGREAVVNLSDMKRIHKSLLMQKVNVESLKEELMEEIGKKMATLMDIEKLDKCDQCMYFYENYIDNVSENFGDK